MSTLQSTRARIIRNDEMFTDEVRVALWLADLDWWLPPEIVYWTVSDVYSAQSFKQWRKIISTLADQRQYMRFDSVEIKYRIKFPAAFALEIYTPGRRSPLLAAWQNPNGTFVVDVEQVKEPKTSAQIAELVDTLEEYQPDLKQYHYVMTYSGPFVPWPECNELLLEQQPYSQGYTLWYNSCTERFDVYYKANTLLKANLTLSQIDREFGIHYSSLIVSLFD